MSSNTTAIYFDEHEKNTRIYSIKIVQKYLQNTDNDSMQISAYSHANFRLGQSLPAGQGTNLRLIPDELRVPPKSNSDLLMRVVAGAEVCTDDDLDHLIDELTPRPGRSNPCFRRKC